MKKLLLPFLLTVLFTLQIFSQNCDECSLPGVAMYDFEIQVERPAEDSLIIKWMHLFYTGPRARYSLRYNETNNDCIRWYDGAMINANLIQDGALKFGNAYTNLPQPGPMESSDYILWGKTEKSGNTYTAYMTLETGPSREVVKTVSTTFTDPSTEAFGAGDLLASQFGSIWQVIKDFEIYKRNTDNMVAIKDIEKAGSDNDVLLVTPETNSVNVGDTINIELQLVDCDGEPLPDRTVQLTGYDFEGIHIDGPENGKFTDDQVVTDSQGKAHTKFTPKSTGTALANASFPHYKPCGAPSVFLGNAILNVPPETVEIEAVWKYKLDIKGDTSWTISQEGTTMSFNSSTRFAESATGKIKAVLERDYSIPLVKAYTKVISLTGNAKYNNNNDFHKDLTISNIGGTYVTKDIEHTSIYGSRIDEPYIEIIINTISGNGYPDVLVNGDIAIYGIDEDKTFSTENGWYNNSYNVEDVKSFSMSFHESNMYDKTVIKNDNTYTYNYITEEDEHDSRTATDYHGHSLYSTEKEEWNIVLTFDGTNTGVEKINSEIPSEFILEQNYPNPFNPSTTIKYQLPVNSIVNLTIYNLLGQEVATLVNERQAAGNYEVKFDASSLCSGIYICKLQSGIQINAKKMILMK